MKPKPTKDGIRQRPASRRFPRGGYEVRWVDPAGVTKRKSFERKSDAIAFRDGTREDIRRGRYIDPKRGSTAVKDVARSWIEANDARPTTLAAYGAILRTYIYPGIGNVHLDRLTPTVLLNFGKRLDDLHRASAEARRRKLAENRERRGKEPLKEEPIPPLSRTRKAHVFAVLNAILNAAVRDGYLDSNPMKRLNKNDKPKRNPRRMLFLDAGQVDALANAVDPRYRTLVFFLAYSGLRAGEAAALRIEDIDWDEKTVTVDESVSDVRGKLEYGLPKTDESHRTVHIPAFVMEMLREQVGDRALDGRAFVFPGSNGNPMRMGNFYNRHLKDAILRVLPDRLHGLTMHDLRHTAASLAYLVTKDMKVVQERLGHANFAITANIYTNVFESMHREASDGLDRLGRAAMGTPGEPDATVTELPR